MVGVNESEKAYLPVSQTDRQHNESQTRYSMKNHRKNPIITPKRHISVSTIR